MAKNIAILAPSSVPFQIGGAEKFLRGLEDALSAQPGVFVEVLKCPCRELSFAEIVSSYEMFYRLDLSHFDMVISCKYPAWMAYHKNHVVYMLHTLRGLYDTYHLCGLPEELENMPRALGDLERLLQKKPQREYLPELFDLCHRALKTKFVPQFHFSLPGPLIRKVVHFMDRAAMNDARAFMAISRTVADRPDYFPPYANVRVVYPPANIQARECGPGDYIFVCSRLYPPKRIKMLVEAMRFVQPDIKMKIAGTGPDMEMLKILAASDPRIEFCGYVPDEELPEMYAGAMFVPFIPSDEDYGLITLEAMKNAKPVLTASDSGGVCEFVKDGITGLTVPPTVEDIGAAMNRLAMSPDLCAEMGKAARERVAGITWPGTARAILEHMELAPLEKIVCARAKVIVCSHAPAMREGSGGERRLFHLCATLARDYDVLLFAAGPRSQRVLEVERPCEGVWQILLPWLDNMGGETELLRTRDNLSVDDMQVMEWFGNNRRWDSIVAGQAEGAVCVIASQPFIYPLIRAALPDMPLVYEAQNVEFDVKAPMFANAPNLLEQTRKMEKECVERAATVFVCSEDNKNRFGELYGLAGDKIFVLPNGVDETPFFAAREKRAMKNKLAGKHSLALFVGSGHEPNVEAVSHIGRIAEQMPETQFVIAGSVGTVARIQAMQLPKNVHLAGSVSEKEKMVLLQACDVALNPVVSGSGTNLKIVEYLACGLECVSTPFGSRGLDPHAWPGLHVCGLEDFSAQIAAVLQKPASDKILRATSARIKERFAWPVLMEPAHGVVASFCGLESRGVRS